MFIWTGFDHYSPRNTTSDESSNTKTIRSTRSIEHRTNRHSHPKEDEILVKVHATTVNRTDCANLQAKPFIMRFVLGLFSPKIIVGSDFAGEVIVQVGSAVSTLQVGDRVFGFNDLVLQSHAEYLTIKPQGNVLPIPKNLSYQQAAYASIEGAHYAYSFLQNQHSARR